jgi:thioredoxin reductase
MSRSEPPRLAILGAGPIGLEAALYAATLKLPFRVYDRGLVGNYLRQWGHARLFTPFGMNATPLGKSALRDGPSRRDLPADTDILTGKEHLATYLESLAALPALREQIQTDSTAVRIGRHDFFKHEAPGDACRARQPFRLLLRNASGQERVEEADVILDCTGTYGHPRHLGDGGIPAIGEIAHRGQIAWGLEDVLGTRKDHYADRTTLVVGAGHSAATTVCNLASLAQKHPSTWIVWLSRRPGTQPLRRILDDPLRERAHLCARANMLATRGEGHVEFHPQSTIESIVHSKEGFSVTAQVAGESRTWQVDRVIANVGGEPDNQLYRELQVQECPATFAHPDLAAALTRSTSGPSPSSSLHAPSLLRQPEPNFFILGAKSYGRFTNFLLPAGFLQVRGAFALITGKADLDLYKKSR